jgi:hypothetical protein
VLHDAKAIGQPKRIDVCLSLSRLESHGCLFRRILSDPREALANVLRICSAKKESLIRLVDLGLKASLK